jgi:hypothetical protein
MTEKITEDPARHPVENRAENRVENRVENRAEDPTCTDQVRRLLTEQRGLASTDQLRRAGLSAAAIRRRLERHWRLILPRVVSASYDAPDPHQRIVAAALYGGSGAVVTSTAAAAWHGITAADGARVVHLEVPCPRDPRGAGFVLVRRTTRPDHRAWPRGPALIASPARAVATAAADAGHRDRALAIVLEALERRIITPGALRHEIESGPRVGSALARAALQEAESGAWSVPEVDLGGLIDASGVLPPGWANPELISADGVRLPCPDYWFDDVALAVQVHSRRFHSGALDWEQTVMSDGVYAEYGVITVAVTPVAIRRGPDQVRRRLERAYLAALTRPRPPVIARRTGLGRSP